MNREYKEAVQKTASEFMSKYHGLSEESYIAMLKSQNYACKICKLVPKSGRPRKNGVPRRTMCVDHNHKTGEIRGLLCHKCNSFLGLANESPVVLLRAIQYLKGNLKE